jgi:VWFA-related protein
MRPLIRLIASTLSRSSPNLLPLVVLFPAFSLAAVAQTRIERSFPVQEKPSITVLNAKSVTLSLADKNEVTMRAELSGAATGNDEIKIQLQNNKLQITCPPPSERTTSLVLLVPIHSRLDVKIYDQKIEIREPAEIINVSSTDNSLMLNVPESTELDLRGVGNVSNTFVQNGGSAMMVFTGKPQTNSGTGVAKIAGNAQPGKEHPRVTVTAKGAKVFITHGNPVAPQTPSTMAASKIAVQNGLMGKALRKSHPELLSSHKAEGELTGANAKESKEEALKLETYLVNLNLSVTDKASRAISGLTQNDLSIYEDNVLQDITFFSTEKAPFNLVLLIDLSGSVRQQIDLIKEAALHFLDLINPQDKVAVITFTTDVQVISPLTNDRDKLRERIRGLQLPNGGTSFYDALGYVLVEELKAVKGQRNAIITITDGQDNALLPASRPPAIQKLIQQQLADAGLNVRPPHLGSYLTFEQLLDGVLEADTLVYPVYLMQQPVLGASPLVMNRQFIEQCEWQLQGLADASGGKLFAAAKIEDLKDVYEQIAAELRTIYSVAYNPRNTNFDGGFRRIRVKVNKTNAAVRTRQGYYAK